MIRSTKSTSLTCGAVRISTGSRRDRFDWPVPGNSPIAAAWASAFLRAAVSDSSLPAV
jgi:hypothetical protein